LSAGDRGGTLGRACCEPATATERPPRGGGGPSSGRLVFIVAERAGGDIAVCLAGGRGLTHAATVRLGTSRGRGLPLRTGNAGQRLRTPCRAVRGGGQRRHR